MTDQTSDLLVDGSALLVADGPALLLVDCVALLLVDSVALGVVDSVALLLIDSAALLRRAAEGRAQQRASSSQELSHHLPPVDLWSRVGRGHHQEEEELGRGHGESRLTTDFSMRWQPLISGPHLPRARNPTAESKLYSGLSCTVR